MISSPERIVVHLVMRQWRLNVVAGIARLAEHQSGEVPLGIVMIAEAESVTPLVYHNVTNHVRAVSVWHRIQPPCVHVDVVIDDYVAFPDGPPGHVGRVDIVNFQVSGVPDIVIKDTDASDGVPCTDRAAECPVVLRVVLVPYLTAVHRVVALKMTACQRGRRGCANQGESRQQRRASNSSSAHPISESNAPHRSSSCQSFMNRYRRLPATLQERERESRGAGANVNRWMLPVGVTSRRAMAGRSQRRSPRGPLAVQDARLPGGGRARETCCARPRVPAQLIRGRSLRSLRQAGVTSAPATNSIIVRPAHRTRRTTTGHSSMRRIITWSTRDRHPRIVIAVWVLIAGALSMGPTLQSVTSNDASKSLPASVDGTCQAE